MNGMLSHRMEGIEAGQRCRRVALAVAMTLCLASAVQAETTEPIHIEALTAKSEYRIGDQIEYVITTKWKSPLQYLRIEPSEALGVFEILLAPETKQTKLRGGWRQERRRYLLSTFETGNFTIPEFFVVYRDAEGAEQRIPTPPVNITVQSVAPVRPDDTGIREAKPPVMPPFRLTQRQVMMIIAGATIAALVAAALIVRAARKRRREPAPLVPPRPIEEVAREQLTLVAQSDLLARGLIKEYFDQISDIIRYYLGLRYGFLGIVTTTSELLDALRDRLSDDGRLDLVAEFSAEADLAKFARWQPDADICSRFLNMAYRVIDETTPQPAAPNAESQASGFTSQESESGEASGSVSDQVSGTEQ